MSVASHLRLAALALALAAAVTACAGPDDRRATAPDAATDNGAADTGDGDAAIGADVASDSADESDTESGVTLADSSDVTNDADASDPDTGTPPVDPDAGGEDDFLAPELLVRPTTRGVTVSVVPRRDLELFVEVAPDGGDFARASPTVAVTAGAPHAVALSDLAPDTAYAYRLRWRGGGAMGFAAGPTRRFHTARAPGQGFVFTVQADPHLDEKTSLDLYLLTLAHEAADLPDFALDLGDLFMCEKHAEPFSAVAAMAPDEATVRARYLFERGNFGALAHSVPLFLVNGNHEGEAGWLLTPSGESVATWATRARLDYFPPPTAGDGFYRLPDEGAPVAGVPGPRGSAYAFTWGDALFVVLDPYWWTTARSKADGWAWTLGRAQYDWLARTLAEATAPLRFVFVHHLVGGLDASGRGGVEAAPFYEWGGAGDDGAPAFEARRPGWGSPIHDLLVAGHATAVFHGHDHLYARQELDGIAYLEVPQPSVANFNSGPGLATEYHYASGVILSSSGHLRVTVGRDEGGRASAVVDYVRAYRPEDLHGARRDGEVADTFALEPR